jgi:hypothetical protein
VDAIAWENGVKLSELTEAANSVLSHSTAPGAAHPLQFRQKRSSKFSAAGHLIGGLRTKLRDAKRGFQFSY